MCQFCEIDENHLLLEGNNANIFHFSNALAPEHFVIAPKRHFYSLSESSDDEINEIFILGKKIAEKLSDKNTNIEKYTIVELVDKGNHFHVHFIPRYVNEKYKIYDFLFGTNGWSSKESDFRWHQSHTMFLRDEIMKLKEKKL